MENLLKIAKVSKSDGTDGAVVFSFLSFEPDDLEISEPVFVHFDGLPVPFFIESFTRRGANKAVVRLNDIRSFEDAEELVGRDVYVEDDGNYENEPDFIGWSVETVVKETIVKDSVVKESVVKDGTRNGSRRRTAPPATAILGKVTDFLDIPGNPCIEVDTEKGAVMIPLHEDFIVSADSETLTLVMSLPEGLL